VPALYRWTLPLILAVPAAAQAPRPVVRAGAAPAGGIVLDGKLDDAAWGTAAAIEGIRTVEPVEGGRSVGLTTIRVLAGPTELLIGIVCKDPDATRITSVSKARDSELRREDYVRLVFDTYLDGRTGYVFAVNPSGARFDALVSSRGESEDARWDGVWEAKTSRDAEGWSVEFRIPLQSLAYRPGAGEWGFNVERRIERLQEVSRWASPIRDAPFSAPSRAGVLTDLPHFSQGLGLTLRPALSGGVEQRPGEATGSVEPSLDVFQKIGPNVLVSGTVNTDFAETEVDTRRTNLTRFSLFFPEKRAFFLEGADLYEFGLGLKSSQRVDIVPFQTRQIGLYQGEEVPVIAGGKVDGRVGRTAFGAMAVHTDQVDSLGVPVTTMGAVRIRQDVLEESSIGVLGTFGDPLGRPDSWLGGVDATFQTSRLGGDKNFLIGVYGMMTGREGLGGDRSAIGGKFDYPNDRWDFALSWKRIGDGFDPSLGFVPRAGVWIVSAGMRHRLRSPTPWLRSVVFEALPSIFTDLDGNWESYKVSLTPLDWTLESGDRFLASVTPEGEVLGEPFEIADGVTIPVGEYHWARFKAEATSAPKRKISGGASAGVGGFYGGTLVQFAGRLLLQPSAIGSVELSAEHNDGSLPEGDFTQDLASARLKINFSPDLQLNALVQYDNVTNSIGANTRVRWSFSPYGDVFFVYNYNTARRPEEGNWAFELGQLLLKAQYAFRF
jgi:hypothetical protein